MKLPSFYDKCLSGCLRSGAKWRRLTRNFPVTARRWPVASKWICLVVGCIGNGVGASVWQNAWQNGMRAIYNQSETDSNLVFTLGGVGGTVYLPAGLVYEVYGTQMNALLAFIMVSISYFLLWLGTGTLGSWRLIFAANQWLVELIYFFVGLCGSFKYISVLLSNAENWPYKQRGKVIGLLDACASTWPTLLTFVYNGGFANGKIQPGEEDQQNLSGYFLTVGCIMSTACIAIFLFVGPIHPSDNTNEENYNNNSNNQVVNNNHEVELAETAQEVAVSSNENTTQSPGSLSEETPPNDFSEFPFYDVPFTRLICHWGFYYLLVSFVIGSSLQVTYQANIPTYLRSFKMNEYNLLFTALGTASQAVTKLTAGFISDLIAQRGRWPRTVVILFPIAVQTLLLFISAFYGDNFILLIFTCTSVGIGTGVVWCQTPTVIGELFGTKHMGSNWGLISIFAAAMGFPFAIGYSRIYEAAIREPGEIYCYGLECFSWSFILFAGTSLVSLIMAIALTQNMLDNAKYRRLNREQKLTLL